MAPNSFEKFQQFLINAAQPLVMASIQNNKVSFESSLGTLLFGEEDQESDLENSPFKRRDDLLIIRLVSDFSEIAKSYYCLQDIAIYIRRFPYGDTDISRVRYLQYHVENHLHEIYLLRERLQKYLTYVERKYRNSSRQPVIDEFISKLRDSIEATLKPVLETRGAHVHEKRFSDGDFDRLQFLEMLKSIPDDKQEQMEWYYSFTYRKIRNKWRGILDSNNADIKQLLDICCEVLTRILFDEANNIILP